MAGTLMYRLQDYAEENKHRQRPIIWYSSSTKLFGECDTIKYFINEFKPTYIIMVLGSNELFIPNILKSRNKLVKSIISQFGNLPYVWIGPPNWKDDTGINELIRQNVGDSSFFLSKHLILDRIADGAHPTKAASAVWMDSIAAWLSTKAKHPILMNTPKQPAKTLPNRYCTIVHPPWKMIKADTTLTDTLTKRNNDTLVLDTSN